MVDSPFWALTSKGRRLWCSNSGRSNKNLFLSRLIFFNNRSAWKEESCSRIELPLLLKRLDIEFPARVVALFQPIPQKRGSSSIPSTFSAGGMPHKRFYLSSFTHPSMKKFVITYLRNSTPTHLSRPKPTIEPPKAGPGAPVFSSGITLIGASVAASVTREREAEGAPSKQWKKSGGASSCKLAPFDRSGNLMLCSEGYEVIWRVVNSERWKQGSWLIKMDSKDRVISIYRPRKF